MTTTCCAAYRTPAPAPLDRHWPGTGIGTRIDTGIGTRIGTGIGTGAGATRDGDEISLLPLVGIGR